MKCHGMSNENTAEIEAIKQVGTQLVDTAEAMALTPKPEKRAAAELFQKVLARELAKELKRLKAA